MIFSKSEFLILVTTLTLTFAIIRDDKYLKIFARKTDISIIKQTNLRASFLPLVLTKELNYLKREFFYYKDFACQTHKFLLTKGPRSGPDFARIQGM